MDESNHLDWNENTTRTIREHTRTCMMILCMYLCTCSTLYNLQVHECPASKPNICYPARHTQFEHVQYVSLIVLIHKPEQVFSMIWEVRSPVQDGYPVWCQQLGQSRVVE